MATTIQPAVKKGTAKKHKLHIEISKAEKDYIGKIKRAFKFEHGSQAVRFALKEVATNIKSGTAVGK